MVIYKYNLKKYMRTVSTWILLAIAIALVGLLTWVISQTPKDNNDVTADQKFILYKLSISQSFTYVGMIILVMVVIFAAFKSVQLFRDEINEGSLLLVISKPISRRRILQQKWMALLTIFFIFITPVVIVHTGILLMYVKPASLQKDIYLGFFSEIGISLILFILFSSLFLMISLKLGVKSILGISFAFVVLLFVSQSLQTLTYSQTFKLQNGQHSSKFETSSSDDISIGVNYTPKYYNYQKDLNAKDFSDSYKKVPKIYSKTGNSKNNFGKIWPIALSYQVGQLNSILFGKYFKDVNDLTQKPMRVKSFKNFDFTTIKNKFYIDQSSRDVALSLITYLNDHSSIWNKNKVTLIKDIQDFIKVTIDSKKIESTEILNLDNWWRKDPFNYIPSSILNFINTSDKYSADANTLYDINNQLNNWYKHYDFGNMIQPSKNEINNNNNLNALFGTLASYYLTKESFTKLGINKLDFNYGMHSIGEKYYKKDASTVCFSNNINNPQDKHSLQVYYKSWINYDEYSYKFYNCLNEEQRKNINFTDLTTLNEYFYTVDFANYVNPYALLISYLVVVVIITPLTYRMFRKSDFS